MIIFIYVKIYILAVILSVALTTLVYLPIIILYIMFTINLPTSKDTNRELSVLVCFLRNCLGEK